MIGDSEVDILTARNCGARSIGCSYGLSPQSLAAAPPDAWWPLPRSFRQR